MNPRPAQDPPRTTSAALACLAACKDSDTTAWTFVDAKLLSLRGLAAFYCSNT